MIEPLYKCDGHRLRPFSQSAQVVCRGGSQPLQRAIVDFGADYAFGQVPDKLEEHYGVSLPSSTVRHITQRHAKSMKEAQEKEVHEPKTSGCDWIVAQRDGSMIPIVETYEETPDKRKDKTLSWKEARRCLAYERGKVTPYFGATFQTSVDKAGQIIFDCACDAGFGNQTEVHALGDGAAWIHEQIEKPFGTQGHYLLDFYPVCEYLSQAAKACCQDEGKEAWLEQHKDFLKEGQTTLVIDALQSHLVPKPVDDKNAPVRACWRYLQNRIDQLDYADAKAHGLPIGSGEIESAHRYIIQKRMKLPGAWWTIDNAKDMLALRVMRANGQWKSYWQDLAKAA